MMCDVATPCAQAPPVRPWQRTPPLSVCAGKRYAITSHARTHAHTVQSTRLCWLQRRARLSEPYPAAARGMNEMEYGACMLIDDA
jgi:hypothetical protein